MEKYRQKVAAAWCTANNSHKEMDHELAEAFAQILRKETEQLEAYETMYDATVKDMKTLEKQNKELKKLRDETVVLLKDLANFDPIKELGEAMQKSKLEGL